MSDKRQLEFQNLVLRCLAVLVESAPLVSTMLADRVIVLGHDYRDFIAENERQLREFPPPSPTVAGESPGVAPD